MNKKLGLSWIRAKYLVEYLIEEIEKAPEEAITKAFDEMLDKNVWIVVVGINSGDRIIYGFKFTNKEAPDFYTDTSARFVENDPNVQYNALIGIPYPVLLAMSANASKKDAFLRYLRLIKEVLIWLVVTLLDWKDGKYEQKPYKEEGYNNEHEISACTGQLLCMLNDKGFAVYKQFVEKAEKGKEHLILFMDTIFNDKYALSKLREFIVDLTEDNYKNVIKYIKSQKNIIKAGI